jgi:dihydroflavonol-4-reductase
MSHDLRATFWTNRAVVLTGATGFVGHHLAMQLRGRGALVTAIVRASSDRRRLIDAGIDCVTAPLYDPAALARACRGAEFVFHLAGAVDFENDWDRFVQVNVEGTRNVATAARAAGVRRFIHTSSIVAVGASRRAEVLDEAAGWNLGGLEVPYVTTKRQAEEVALSTGGPALEVVVANPASVVGPEDYSRSEFGTLCRRFWRGRIPFYFGGGGNNFVDVRDVALGHLLAAERGRAGERYILGGENRSYGEFFADLARTAGRRIFRLRLPTALGSLTARLNERLPKRGRAYLTRGQLRLLSLFFHFDSGKARRELGYRPRPLAESLRDAHRFWIEKSSA